MASCEEPAARLVRWADEASIVQRALGAMMLRTGDRWPERASRNVVRALTALHGAENALRRAAKELEKP